MDLKQLAILCAAAFALHRLFTNKARSDLSGSTQDPEVQELLKMEKYIHPALRRGSYKKVGPKHALLYAVPFFKPEYCEMLVRVAERYGDWEGKSKDNYGKGMTLSLSFIPALEKQYSALLKKYLYPQAQQLFPTFRPTHHDKAYILRYRATKNQQRKMSPHYDGEPLSCILSLNDSFTGGGTVFPQFDYTAKLPPGYMLVYPGGLSHLHGGKEITHGRRYVLLHALYDRVLFGNCVSPWEDGEPQHRD